METSGTNASNFISTNIISSFLIRSSGPSVVKWSKMKVLRTGLNLNDRIELVFLIPAPRTVRKMVSVCKSYSSLKISPFPLKKCQICLCGNFSLKKEYSTEYSGNILWNILQNILGNIPWQPMEGRHMASPEAATWPQGRIENVF